MAMINSERVLFGKVKKMSSLECQLSFGTPLNNLGKYPSFLSLQ